MPGFVQAALGAAEMVASTSVAAGITIAHRVAMLSDPAKMNAHAGRTEAFRMVMEKVEAATEGSFEAGAEAARFMLRSTFAHMSPDDFAKGLMSIGMAATQPAARRVRANARRLAHG